MSTAPLASTEKPSDAQLPAPDARTAIANSMHINFFTARPSPMWMRKVYARDVHVLSAFWAKFFAIQPRAGVDIAMGVG